MLLPVGLTAQETWTWSRQVPQGQHIEIKGVNGGVEARLASGSEVRVSARKHARRSDIESVKIEVVEHQGGVTICAVYPAPEGRRENTCEPGEGGRNNTRNNDVNVDFTVEVPRGVDFVARTVNGGIEGAGLQSDVEAYTVNGGVDIATSGLTRARTVNGSVDVTVGRADWQNELELQTVNGGISFHVTGELNAEVTASTVNGDIDTDFPLTVRGRFGPKRLTGTIGSGGRELLLTTVNGDIAILKN
jgi:DUF4097 and DUF4098 domain-containing protein YvlB